MRLKKFKSSNIKVTNLSNWPTPLLEILSKWVAKEKRASGVNNSIFIKNV